MIRRVVALLALFAIAQTRYAGRPLGDVLRELQSRGLNIVYSSDLVKPEARVVAEPRSTRDRQILDEILAPHGLAAKEGPGGVILVVRAETRPEDRTARPAPIAAIAAESTMPVSLAEIVVTASEYPVLGSAPEHRQFLTRQEVNRTPHLGDDLFRALGRLPGTSSTEFSAAIGIRGGTPDDVLVLIDGLEIAQPFHLKYFQNAISVLDSEAIGSLDFMSGGAPVEYGQRMGGVIDMSTSSASRTNIGVSFTHARFLNAGTFAGDRGEWLISARRGYFDLLLDVFYKDVKPRPKYGDVIGKVQYRIGDRSVLSADVLSSSDKIKFNEDDIVDASYEDNYGWANLRTAWTPRVSSQIVASHSRIRQKKDGGYRFFNAVADVVDHRSFDISGMKQDWTYDRTDRNHYVKWGVDAKHIATDYHHTTDAHFLDPLLGLAGSPLTRQFSADTSPSGNSVAFYAADRVRVAPGVTIEGGARWERESWSGESAMSRRVNAVFTPGPRTALRASWGEYRQPHRLDELLMDDGDATIYPAQRSRQAELGVEHHFDRGGITARMAAYRRTISKVRPRYENIFDRDEFFPEAKYDRVRVAPDRTTADGVELLLKDDDRGPISWWVSLARSSAIDHFGSIEMPRGTDQPTAASFSINFQKSARWNFNLSAQIHTGWPTTAVIPLVVNAGTKNAFLTATLGERNRIRYETYQRLDIRALRRVAMKHGTFSGWIDITNVFDRKNGCCGESLDFSADLGTGVASVSKRPTDIGILPSFGFVWEF